MHDNQQLELAISRGTEIEKYRKLAAIKPYCALLISIIYNNVQLSRQRDNVFTPRSCPMLCEIVFSRFQENIFSISRKEGVFRNRLIKKVFKGTVSREKFSN